MTFDTFFVNFNSHPCGRTSDLLVVPLLWTRVVQFFPPPRNISSGGGEFFTLWYREKGGGV